MFETQSVVHALSSSVPDQLKVSGGVSYRCTDRRRWESKKRNISKLQLKFKISKVLVTGSGLGVMGSARPAAVILQPLDMTAS